MGNICIQTAFFKGLPILVCDMNTFLVEQVINITVVFSFGGVGVIHQTSLIPKE